jgi:tetratricopeptide (TPR) repeat protein
MSEPAPDDSDVHERLNELSRKYTEFDERCLDASAARIARETARLAQEHNRLVPYLDARFRLMNKAQGLLEPEMGRQTAIEILSYLESEDRARAFQPDFEEEDYARTVGWMSACAYDNLAVHTAEQHGYNSEGMHQCISEGMDVCRCTGKLRCITCFREYATDVYLSSDDVPMALHFARMVRSLPEDAPGSERRWVGCKDEAWILVLCADTAGSDATYRQSLVLAESYHTPLAARHESLQGLETLLLAVGKHEQFHNQYGATVPPPPPRGEWVAYDLEADQIAALEACCRGDFARAQELLTRWDRWLTEHEALHHWFEVRLRLIACQVLAGAQQKVEALAKQLEERAWKARDWLTLHRLSRLFDPAQRPSPLALLGPLREGPFAGTRVEIPVPEDAPAEAATAEPPAPPAEAVAEPPPPLEATVQQLIGRLNGLQDDDSRRALLADVLAVPPAMVTHPADAARLLHLLEYVLGNDPPEALAAIWTWAQTVAGSFSQVPVVLNLLAALGDLLRHGPHQEMAEKIPGERLERLFRESLDLDPFHSRNHFRAGIYYLGEDNLGEAERCLARGCRLERNFGPLALRLAEVYNRTERPRDALMVLDSCLREGCDDPQVAWEACTTAFGLNQFEPLLAYAERYEQLEPGAPWLNYYRAVALLEVGRPQEALAAVAEEVRRSPAHTLPPAILRACAEQALGNAEAVRHHLADALAVPLAAVDYLTFRGVLNLFERLWNTVGRKLPADESLRCRLEQRLLATGLAPDDFFEEIRDREQVQDDVFFYRCRLRLQLDASWASSEGCLHGQQGWDHYHALWGVLARDEDAAVALARCWQEHCGPWPAAVVEVDAEERAYRDKSGVVWQGQRWCEENPETPEAERG